MLVPLIIDESSFCFVFLSLLSTNIRCGNKYLYDSRKPCVDVWHRSDIMGSLLEVSHMHQTHDLLLEQTDSPAVSAELFVRSILVKIGPFVLSILVEIGLFVLSMPLPRVLQCI